MEAAVFFSNIHGVTYLKTVAITFTTIICLHYLYTFTDRSQTRLPKVGYIFVIIYLFLSVAMKT